MTTLASNNDAWGFWGTMSRIKDTAADVAVAWAIASRAIAQTTGGSPEGVRDFLDSRDGRHFADCVEGGLCDGRTLAGAIDAAIADFEGWRIDRKLSRQTGIPHGLPYLTGLVTHFAIMAETA